MRGDVAAWVLVAASVLSVNPPHPFLTVRLAVMLAVVAVAGGLSRVWPAASLAIGVGLAQADGRYYGVVALVAFLAALRTGRIRPLAWSPALAVPAVFVDGAAEGAWSLGALVAELAASAALPWLLGRNLRQRRLLAAAGWERARRLEREHEMLADRARLPRTGADRPGQRHDSARPRAEPPGVARGRSRSRPGTRRRTACQGRGRARGPRRRRTSCTRSSACCVPMPSQRASSRRARRGHGGGGLGAVDLVHQTLGDLVERARVRHGRGAGAVRSAAGLAGAVARGAARRPGGAHQRRQARPRRGRDGIGRVRRGTAEVRVVNGPPGEPAVPAGAAARAGSAADRAAPRSARGLAPRSGAHRAGEPDGAWSACANASGWRAARSRRPQQAASPWSPASPTRPTPVPGSIR
ncbi:hypothetical protein ACU686_25550 [Yinghuangia aomiensis]